MRKGISPIISAVLLILISVSAIYLVLNVAKPTVDRAYEYAATNEAGQNMQLLDNWIREVASEGTGSFRKFVMKVSDGDYRIVNTGGNFTGAVQYKINLEYSPYTAPMLKKVGDIKYTAGMNAIGLVGYWNLDDRNGTTADDNSGYSNDGTLYNGSTSCTNPPTIGAGCPQWVDGKFGKALSLDGSNDYIWLGNSTSLQVATPTLEAWFKTSSTSYQQIYRWRLFGVMLSMKEGGQIQFGFYNSSAVLFFAVSTSLYNDNSWHFAVGTYDNQNVKLYIDGVPVGTNATTAPSFYGTGGAAIGRDGDSSSSYWNGTIDEVRIYNRALSTDEVEENYNSKASNYQAVLEYSKIVITGTAKFGKGDNNVCIEKIGESNNKPLIRITKC
jgi:flagellin-like protein